MKYNTTARHVNSIIKRLNEYEACIKHDKSIGGCYIYSCFGDVDKCCGKMCLIHNCVGFKQHCARSGALSRRFRKTKKQRRLIIWWYRTMLRRANKRLAAQDYPYTIEPGVTPAQVRKFISEGE